MASVLRQLTGYPDALPDVLPLFAGIVLITHRELIAHLLNRNLTGHGKSQRRSHRRASRSPPGMILAGEPNTACLTYARQTWAVSRSGATDC